MTPDLKQLQELLAKATHGEWESRHYDDSFEIVMQYVGTVGKELSADDAAFILAAHNGMEALLASHEALSARVKELEGMLGGGGKNE